jgi:hypothetical protein
MKARRENLNKIKALCESLNDRNSQLKINASTLWFLLDEIKFIIEDLSKLESNNDQNNQKLNAVIKRLSNMADIVETRGCKAIQNER